MVAAASTKQVQLTGIGHAACARYQMAACATVQVPRDDQAAHVRKSGMRQQHQRATVATAFCSANTRPAGSRRSAAEHFAGLARPASSPGNLHCSIASANRARFVRRPLAAFKAGCVGRPHRYRRQTILAQHALPDPARYEARNGQHGNTGGIGAPYLRGIEAQGRGSADGARRSGHVDGGAGIVVRPDVPGERRIPFDLAERISHASRPEPFS